MSTASAWPKSRHKGGTCQLLDLMAIFAPKSMKDEGLGHLKTRLLTKKKTKKVGFWGPWGIFTPWKFKSSPLKIYVSLSHHFSGIQGTYLLVVETTHLQNRIISPRIGVNTYKNIRNHHLNRDVYGLLL